VVLPRLVPSGLGEEEGEQGKEDGRRRPGRGDETFSFTGILSCNGRGKKEEEDAALGEKMIFEFIVSRGGRGGGVKGKEKSCDRQAKARMGGRSCSTRRGMKMWRQRWIDGGCMHGSEAQRMDRRAGRIES
jgi:hypothetical protein